MNFVRLFLLLLLLPLSLHAQEKCDGIFNPEKAQIVQQWLTDAGLQAPLKISKYNAVREKMIMSRLNPIQLEQVGYRRWWIDKVIDLKISEGVDPLANFESFKSKSQRENLRRLVMRSIVAHGLEDYMNSDIQDASTAGHLIAISRWIRFSPLYQALFQWKIPIKPVPPKGQLRPTLQPTMAPVLSEEQIAAIIAHGMDAVNADPALKVVVGLDHREAQFLKYNMMVARIVGLALIINSYLKNYPKVLKAMRKSQHDAEHKATTDFVKKVQAATVAPDLLLLQLAKNDEDEIVASFLMKNHRAPTADENEQIRNYVCNTELGGALDDAGIKKCLAL